jgi:hypothetical protein
MDNHLPLGRRSVGSTLSLTSTKRLPAVDDLHLRLLSNTPQPKGMHFHKRHVGCHTPGRLSNCIENCGNGDAERCSTSPRIPPVATCSAT